MNFKLNLLIDEADLPIVRIAGQKITLAKPVGDSDPNVAWLVIDPFKANTIEWEEVYGLYASTGKKIVQGATLVSMSDKFPSSDGTYYSFDTSATFKGPSTGSNAPTPGTFRVYNQMPAANYSALTFGLEQKAIVNGNTVDPAFVNATIVPAANRVDFTPLTTVWVWLQADYTSGTVITQVMSDYATVTFGGTVIEQTLKYDSSTGRFIPASPDGQLVALEEAPHVKLLKPQGVY